MNALVLGWCCVGAMFLGLIYAAWTMKPIDLGHGYVSEAESWRRWSSALSPKEQPKFRAGTR